MSFPNVIYGDYGEEHTTYAIKPASIELGRRMVLPDGRLFAFCKASATAVVSGKLYQQNSLGVVAGTADADILNALVTVSGGVAGSSTVVVTLAGTAALSADLLKGGTIFWVSGTGGGESYKIKGNTVAGSVSACTVTVEGTFKTTIAAGTTLAGLRQNRFDNITLTTADTVEIGALAGVSPNAIPASNFGWVQRNGTCACLTDGTLIVGRGVGVASTAAGAVHVATASTTATIKDQLAIGRCLNVAASASYSLIDLMLE